MNDTVSAHVVVGTLNGELPPTERVALYDNQNEALASENRAVRQCRAQSNVLNPPRSLRGSDTKPRQVSTSILMLHSFPDNPELAFFDHPGAQRAAELCAARLAERYKDHWRSPKSVVSCASSSENEEISDPDLSKATGRRLWEFIWPDGKCSNLEEIIVPSGPSRASHDLLISNTFAFHPFFGTGHVLRTNGVICMFWTGGSTVEIVEQKNLCFLRLVLAGERAGSPRQRRLAAAMTED